MPGIAHPTRAWRADDQGRCREDSFRCDGGHFRLLSGGLFGSPNGCMRKTVARPGFVSPQVSGVLSMPVALEDEAGPGVGIAVAGLPPGPPPHPPPRRPPAARDT